MKAICLLLFSSFFLNLSAQTTWNGSSWDNGTPNSTIDAIITGSYDSAVHGNFTAKNLNVTASGSLLISSNTNVTVQTNVDNLGTFIIEDSGSLLMLDDTGTVSGNYVVKRNSPDYPVSDINSFYSSPVIEADSNFAAIFNTDDIIYYWDTSASPTFWVGPLNHSTNNIGLGKGYAVRPDNSSGVITRTYTGQLNTGDISVPVYYSDSSTSPGQFGYNIIGNPYPSAIDWFAFKADNASILSGTMYYWRQLEVGPTNFASDYVALNSLGVVPYNAATEFIGTAQGFVAKTNATTNVIFKNSHRIASPNDQFFRTSESRTQSRMLTQGNSWFNLESSTELSTILIGFNSNASTGFDDDYDGIFIGGTDLLQLYSLNGADKLTINGQPELVPPNDVDIPLGIVTSATGNYTISIDEEFIGPEYFIKLEDTETTSITDLRLSDYTFSIASAGENNTRFILHYEYDTSLSVNEETLNEQALKLFFTNDTLNIIVNENNLPKSVEVYDISGKLLFDKAFESSFYIPSLKSGLYVVKVNYEDFNSITKLTIKK